MTSHEVGSAGTQGPARHAHLFVGDWCEAAISRGWVEGQHMQATDDTCGPHTDGILLRHDQQREFWEISLILA